MAFRSDKRMFVMKSADKGEHWTFHAEVASESTPSRTVPQEGFTLKVFDDGRSLVVGYNYLYVFTSGGDIAERIPPPEGSGSYPYVYRNISYSYSEYFAAYDTERMVCHLKGNGQFYLTEEAEEE
jgi:hypothetical protein